RPCTKGSASWSIGSPIVAQSCFRGRLKTPVERNYANPGPSSALPWARRAIKWPKCFLQGEDNLRFAFALCLAGALLAPIISNGADRKESGGPWIATAAIVRNGEQAGSGVYLNSGLIITAAHLTAVDAKMGVRIAGMVLPELPAKVLKQGSSEDVDLSLLLVDEEKLLTSIRLPRMQLCEAPPWPGDPVIVVDARHATESHVVSPRVLPYTS